MEQDPDQKQNPYYYSYYIYSLFHFTMTKMWLQSREEIVFQ
jgi:hypothetical protein